MPVEGIDVSNRNDGRLPGSGFDYLFAKASEGVRYNDPFFEGYVADAQRLGIPWGPYHFARPDANPPEQEAAWFLRNAQRGPLGWGLDIEGRDLFDDQGHKIGHADPLTLMGAAPLADWVERFRELVEPTLGRSWIYCNRSYATPLYPRLSPDWRTWLATLEGHPKFPTFAGRTIDIEQYAIVEVHFPENPPKVVQFDRDLARTPLIIDAGEDDDMVPPAIIQLVDTNGDLVVMPAGGGRPWTAKAADAPLIAVFVFRVFDPDPSRRYKFPDPIQVIADPMQVAAFRSWAAPPP